MQFILDLLIKGRPGEFLSTNYQYELSAAISNILNNVAPNDRWLLRNDGPDACTSVFKPFTYGELKLDDRTGYPGRDTRWPIGRSATLDIRFVGDHITEELIRRVFINQWIDLGEGIKQMSFQIIDVRAMEPIVFDAEVIYRSITPIYLPTQASTDVSSKGCPFHRLIKVSLLQRLLSFQPGFPALKNKLDQYCPDIQLKLLNEPKKATVTFKNSAQCPVQVMGYYFDFKLRASPVLHELGYYGGFGNKNWLGLGCVDVMA